MALPFEDFNVASKVLPNRIDGLGTFTRQDNDQFMAITGRTAPRENVVNNGVLSIDPLPTAESTATGGFTVAMEPGPYRPPVERRPAGPARPPASDAPSPPSTPVSPPGDGPRIWPPVEECSTPVGENPDLDAIRPYVCTGAGQAPAQG